MRRVFAVSLLVALATCERTYHGYQVLRTETLDAPTALVVMEELAEGEGISFWKDPAPGRNTDIMAAPHLLKRLESWLAGQGIAYYTMDWDDYHTHDELNAFIGALADANEWASIINI